MVEPVAAARADEAKLLAKQPGDLPGHGRQHRVSSRLQERRSEACHLQRRLVRQGMANGSCAERSNLVGWHSCKLVHDLTLLNDLILPVEVATVGNGVGRNLMT